MIKGLTALVFGVAMSIPASLDASMFVPCTAKVITIKEYPATPRNSISTGTQRESLSLWDKYRYGVVYTHSVSYEESVYPLSLRDGTTTLIF